MTWRRNDKGDSLNASYYHIVNPLTAVGAEVSHSFSSNENTITVGAQHALDPLTTLKARVNNAGKASALVQHQWRPKSFFTVSGEVDTKAIENCLLISFSFLSFFVLPSCVLFRTASVTMVSTEDTRRTSDIQCRVWHTWSTETSSA